MLGKYLFAHYLPAHYLPAHITSDKDFNFMYTLNHAVIISLVLYCISVFIRF